MPHHTRLSVASALFGLSIAGRCAAQTALPKHDYGSSKACIWRVIKLKDSQDVCHRLQVTTDSAVCGMRTKNPT